MARTDSSRDHTAREYDSEGDERAFRPPAAGPRSPVDDAHLRGSLDGEEVQRAVPLEPRERPDRPVGRVRPADADRLRRRPRARARRGGQGRGADRPSRGDERAHGRHPAGDDEHLDDDQRDGGLAARALHRHGRGARGRPAGPAGHDAERHHQGVPRARDVRVPARAVDAAHRRHGRLHGHRGPALEPDQHLLLPPAGGGATPVQEIAYALSNAIAVLDAVRERVDEELMGKVFSRISFFVNAGRAVRRGAREAARDGAASGSRSAASATACRTTSSCASATACRSTRSA